MNKFFRILFINIFIICILIFTTEFICIYLYGKVVNNDVFHFKTHILRAIKSYTNNSYFQESDFRKSTIKMSDKKPIAIMGCSYAYGLGLKEEETLSTILSNLTNRSVYNLGVIATSPREILYILRNNELRTKLLNNETNLEYIIYPYISHHKFRLYTDIKPFTYSPYFKQTENGLEYYENNNFWVKTYTYKKFLDLKSNQINEEEAFQLICLYLKEINEEIKKHFPSAKFVILIYEDYLNKNWGSLEEEDIIIVKVKDLLDIDVKSLQYTISPTDVHPNAKAWQIITPELVKKLNL